jgi:Ca2+-binding EF-hand superfamily protein
MKTNIKTLVTLLALAAMPLIATAQDNGNPPPDGDRPPHHQGPGGPGTDGQRPPGPPPPLLNALDANHDGTIDETEIANASAALKTLDKNGDGKLTKDELRPQRPEGGNGQDGQRPPRQDGQGGPRMDGQRPMGTPPPLVNALDANHDGTIDATEVANASTALKTLDKNSDGKLTKDELRPMRPQGMGGQGDPGGPGGQRGPKGPPPQDQNQQ